MLISIILTIKEESEVNTPTLLSCINQSYTNIEIIVINHKDEEYILPLKDERITLYHLPKSNISQARNAGLQKATGEAITFIESPQEIHEEWIEKASQRLHIAQADAVQCGTMYEREHLIEKLAIANDSLFGFYQRLLVRPTIPINSVVVKRDLCTLFPEDKVLLGDWEFWLTTLKGKKVDVQGEYFGSIIHLTKPLDSKNSLAYEKERLIIMENHFKDLSFSLRKLKQLLAIKALRKNLMA